MKRMLLLGTLCSFFTPVFTLAQESAPVTARILNMNEAVRSYPGGPLVGTLSKNVTVKLLEQREDFVRVSFEGWVKDSSLALASSESKPSSQEPATPERSLFELTGYELKPLSAYESGDKKRVVLTLKLKNISEASIAAWEGLLVVQGPKGEVLFRTSISSSGEAIAAGATGSVSFNWSEGEKEFDVLTSYSLEQLKILLLKVNLLTK